MRISVMRFVLCLTVLLLLTTYGVLPQTSETPAPSRPDSEQILKDLLNEVRLLRAEIRRQSLNNHRSQLLLQRMRAQQDQVVRLRHDISDIHDRLDEMRDQAQKKKRALDDWKALVKNWDPTIEISEMKALAREVEELDNREQSLVQRESQLTKDLASAESDLADLNRRLDQIEWEMSRPGVGDDPQPGAKRPQ